MTFRLVWGENEAGTMHSEAEGSRAELRWAESGHALTGCLLVFMITGLLFLDVHFSS